jgi:hypothetical protein
MFGPGSRLRLSKCEFLRPLKNSQQILQGTAGRADLRTATKPPGCDRKSDVTVGQKDLCRAGLDQIVDMNHPLAKLASAIDGGFLQGLCPRSGAIRRDGPIVVLSPSTTKYTSDQQGEQAQPTRGDLAKRATTLLRNPLHHIPHQAHQ